MSAKRKYHKWTEREAVLLYKTVVGSDRNWRMVERAFPDFSLLQLQNKFTILEQQYSIKSAKDDPAFQKQCYLETQHLYEPPQQLSRGGREPDQISNASLQPSDAAALKEDGDASALLQACCHEAPGEWSPLPEKVQKVKSEQPRAPQPETSQKEETNQREGRAKERAYHHWTKEETLLLYKTVQKNRNNWKEVMKALPQFSLLQLQNKYVMIQKQFKLRTKNKQGLDEYDNQNMHQNDLVISDDTLQVLLDLISKKE
ncbi:Myb-like_DNA-binding domain-containing protein [Hexamita inflata]|uniref:Myb-like DNA-binding domain-containing protein n=1 Tax=Hexamita inflata TaxID=28002 RepID=A0AA86QN68_9EUKA|nr:Myb-like DNA-binding domain-containing protein [Hexamita inflata]